ncbi:hypothetical protein M413DRAFT_362567 [Hebeloma cylindrosporum]|uniref:Uncharacterized protein n=1 Tax=Hebeloma cylindrosporum TaxID=76867 RepID=A0A0C2Y4J8_HEBCY|nr:hypothetical protein M413DRAFT_362567 [Hebeloma cylindrosporum h7]
MIVLLFYYRTAPIYPLFMYYPSSSVKSEQLTRVCCANPSMCLICNSTYDAVQVITEIYK